MSRPILAFVALLFALTASSAYTLNGAAGRGAVRDDKNYSDRVTLTMIGVPSTPRDMVYEAWLVTDNGLEQTSLGNLKVESDGTLKQAVTRDENFFARYNKLRVSLEPRDKKDPKQAGNTVFEGEIPLPVMQSLRQLLVHFPEAPGGTAAAIGLRTQTSVVLKQLNQATAVSTKDLGKVKENAEAVVNTIEGSKGPDFGDLNGDKAVQNPGDGYGLLTYADQVVKIASELSSAEGATPDMQQNAGYVQSSAKNVATWAGQIRDDALSILKAGDPDTVKPLLDDAAKKGAAALNGIDANNNGLIEPIEGEGGAATAYIYAQDIGLFDVKSVEEPPANKDSAGAPQQGDQGATTPQPGDQGAATPQQGDQGTPAPQQEGQATPAPQQEGQATPAAQQGDQATPAAQQEDQGTPTSEQGMQPSNIGSIPLIALGILVGTAAIGVMALLWVRSKLGITRP